jgi:hypothetical protein
MSSKTADRQMEELSIAVHGVLAFGHLIGFLYNYKRENWFDAGAHGLAGMYDVWAVNKHINHCRDL